MNLPSLNEFKLSCELVGHSMDVRAVCCGIDANTIISGSRDKTVKIWRRNEENGFDVITTLKHHKHFVSCVYYLARENWICTGSNDSTIHIYRDGTVDPFVELRGHEDTVCSLAKGLGCKTLISGSWDKTARVWSIADNGTSTFKILKGHLAAVWSVESLLSSEKYITGSADKNIILWNNNGQKFKVLKGHTDCIRDLILFGDNSVMSCGNDAIIKYWSNDGEFLKDFIGHTNFIYSISKNSVLGSEVFVSAGEDSAIRLWSLSHGQLGEELLLPAQSVWSVICLSNGDIVTGSSDGVIRIFTRDPTRMAGIENVRQFQLAVETRKIENVKTLGGCDKDSFPGPEVLTQPGTKEGQTKMIREANNKVCCYIWENNNWNKLGEVVGASGGTQENSGKTLYDGKEYDYVFSVDVSETEPPKKLPYNIGEDPWFAAQNFIDRNNLPQVYLDQVANFIIKNSNTGTVEQSVASGFQDPFTGESRYVPGSSKSNHGVESVNSFTGISTDSLNECVMSEKVPIKHFPITKFWTFDMYDAEKVLDKLREFNLKSGDMKVNEQTLQLVVKLADQKHEVNSAVIETLINLLYWPEDILFPVLDITRLAVRDEQFFSLLKPRICVDNFLQHLNTNLPNQLMTVRCLANLMSHQLGREYIRNDLHKIINSIKELRKGSTNLQIAVATFYLNSSIMQLQTDIIVQDKCEIIFEGVMEFLKWAFDLEAWYRCMQTLGNLSNTSYRELILAKLISVDYVITKIRKFTSTPPETGWEKISECAHALIAIL